MQEYYFKEGCFIEEWHNQGADQDCSIAHVRVEPKQSTKLHALKNTTERYVMLSGYARVTVGDRSWEIAPKDVVVINADIAQKVENLSDQDLKFLAICTPRFKEENYYEVQI